MDNTKLTGVANAEIAGVAGLENTGVAANMHMDSDDDEEDLAAEMDWKYEPQSHDHDL